MISTARLELEAAGAHHVEEVVEAIADSIEELRPWMAWAVKWDPEDSRTYMLNRPDSDHLHVIKRGGRVVGVVNVLVSKPQMGTGELGYWIATQEAGQGLITEALDAFITWSFDVLELHRLELRAGVDNAASNRVAEKLGFRNCGVMREAALGADGYYDCHMWELVAGDPRPEI